MFAAYDWPEAHAAAAASLGLQEGGLTNTTNNQYKNATHYNRGPPNPTISQLLLLGVPLNQNLYRISVLLQNRWLFCLVTEEAEAHWENETGVLV